MTEAPDDASAAGRPARRALRQRLLAEGEEFVASAAAPAAEAALGSALRALVAQLEPDCLGLYHALRCEFNAAQALDADVGFKELPLALPYARRAGRSMEFRRWNRAAPTLADECGIASCEGAVVVPDVVLVPCVGFTAAGHRLGYGGGYFDRWLAAHPQVTAVGVAWSFAEIAPADFTPESHDVALSLIVTEHGVR